jgi:hypothetical protein
MRRCEGSKLNAVRLTVGPILTRRYNLRRDLYCGACMRAALRCHAEIGLVAQIHGRGLAVPLIYLVMVKSSRYRQ